jgi:hypothetical protein
MLILIFLCGFFVLFSLKLVCLSFIDTNPFLIFWLDSLVEFYFHENYSSFTAFIDGFIAGYSWVELLSLRFLSDFVWSEKELKEYLKNEDKKIWVENHVSEINEHWKINYNRPLDAYERFVARETAEEIYEYDWKKAIEKGEWEDIYNFYRYDLGFSQTKTELLGYLLRKIFGLVVFSFFKFVLALVKWRPFSKK